MRNALARALYELAKADERIVVLVADISPAGAMEDFRREFPSRFINVGVAEQAMIGLAAGLAMRGFKPFCYTIATFALFRPYEFIRCDLAYQNLSVTVVGMGAGLSYSTLGGTHQAVEDVAVAMACPNLTVLAPCDPAETVECARWCAEQDSGGPVYLRIGKAGELTVTEAADPWEFGKMRLIRATSGYGTLLVTYGPIVGEVLRAARMLHADVMVASRLTAISEDDQYRLTKYDRVVIIEEASGAPLAQWLRTYSVYPFGSDQMQSIALPREFPHIHGTREELLGHFGLTAEKIVAVLR